MGTIKVDLTNKYGKFKMLNATNGGPIYKRHAADQWRTNITEYKDARIPFSRNHDSNAIASYGGPYAHDISAIFHRRVDFVYLGGRDEDLFPLGAND